MICWEGRQVLCHDMLGSRGEAGPGREVLCHDMLGGEAGPLSRYAGRGGRPGREVLCHDMLGGEAGPGREVLVLIQPWSSSAWKARDVQRSPPVLIAYSVYMPAYRDKGPAFQALPPLPAYRDKGPPFLPTTVREDQLHVHAVKLPQGKKNPSI